MLFSPASVPWLSWFIYCIKSYCITTYRSKIIRLFIDDFGSKRSISQKANAFAENPAEISAAGRMKISVALTLCIVPTVLFRRRWECIKGQLSRNGCSSRLSGEKSPRYTKCTAASWKCRGKGARHWNIFWLQEFPITFQRYRFKRCLSEISTNNIELKPSIKNSCENESLGI